MDGLEKLLIDIGKFKKHIRSGGPSVSRYYRDKIQSTFDATGYKFIRPNSTNAATYIKFLNSSAKTATDAKSQALHQIITNLSNNFDEFMYRIAFKYYLDNPERMRNEADISFRHVLSLLETANIEYELVKVMVFKKMFSANLEDRYAFLQKILKKNASSLPIRSGLKELYLVRNAIVHNGSFVSEQLTKKFPEYLGYKKLQLTFDDYARFKKDVFSSAHDLRMLFHHQNTIRSYNGSHYLRLIQEQRDEAKALYRLRAYGSSLVYTGTSLDFIKKLSSETPKSFYRTISQFLNSHVFEHKYLGVYFLRDAWGKSYDDGKKQELAAFLIKNLSALSNQFLAERATPILVWYVKYSQPKSLSILAGSITPSHRKLAIDIFKKGDLINDDGFGVAAVKRLPYKDRHPRVKTNFENYIVFLQGLDHTLYRKVLRELGR
ncbi:MAG: hypothetical protein WBP26_04045 [Candidatus Saccharimonadales bacterium]